MTGMVFDIQDSGNTDPSATHPAWVVGLGFAAHSGDQVSLPEIA
jgi:hypothetical protein